ncbi:S-formylglutathione hydrolase [Vibrio hippocampi]|uniref:S-formylglutathione hydrolase n=1 Tax=Vibrio hippocampi TaxID=654686 RepID=A0ABN8DH15_9VIBR|nr:S-formylglutathione hydrolase [Vibrio hippocampi]CAH0524927.1 S-formylglutathione hydrolase [Vibrio hippocampi]
MLEKISQAKVFGGWHQQFTHLSKVVNCSMRFAIYLPEEASSDNPVPVLYWLSGLTCTDENFMQKAAAFKAAAKLGIAIVAPDTSPRGKEVPDDADEAYDFGHGAGFYVDALQLPWKTHYQMYSYIVGELPDLIEAHFPVSKLRSISGHSMGGHGALVIGLRNSERYCSISAFSPISHPIDCPWGTKALSHYLGKDIELWKQYDAVELLKQAMARLPILVDQGEDDPFLASQLKPDLLLSAAERSGSDVKLRMQPGYDHSYFFIQSFIEDHLRFHAGFLHNQERAES